MYTCIYEYKGNNIKNILVINYSADLETIGTKRTYYPDSLEDNATRLNVSVCYLYIEKKTIKKVKIKTTDPI